MKLKKEFIKLVPERRLYKLTVPVLGLTGGIASGKTTVSKMLAQKGMVVIDADKLVKSVYATSDARNFIVQNFPQAMSKGEIDFPYLRRVVFRNETMKTLVETFIYPRLEKAFDLAMKPHEGAPFVVYDIPLLFERGLQAFFDVKVLVYAPRDIQLSRLIQRDGHQESMADEILDLQMDIELKKPLVDVIIDNSRTEAELALEVEHFIARYFEA